MKFVVVGAVALPVVLGGFGIAAAAIFAPDPSPHDTGGATVSAHGNAAENTDVSDLGTSIDGRRPHLTVINGSASVALPGSLTGIVSMLPLTVFALTDDTPALTGVPGTAQPWTGGNVGGGAGGGAPRRVGPVPPSYVPEVAPRGAARPSNLSPPAYPAPVPAPIGPSAPDAPHAPAAPAVDPDDEDSRPPGGWDVDRESDWDSVRDATRDDDDDVLTAPDARVTDSGPRGRSGPPPHASDTGRPDHADTTGPPPHAKRQARSDTTSSRR